MAAPGVSSTGPRRNPPRLNIINPSISLSQQQAQALFSPALQTAIHTGVGSGFPVQTPMQPYFGAPGQAPHMPPRRGSGHQGRNSISHFPGNQPLGTPLGGHFPRPSMMLPNGQPSPLIGVGPPGPGQPLGPIIINNGPPPSGHRPHKRQMSIGGPPKAVLGGPQRKVSPNPSAAAIAAVGAATLKKKIVVNLPQESEVVQEDGDAKDAEQEGEAQGDGGEGLSTSVSSKKRVRKEWARAPIPVAEGEAILASYVPIPDEELVSRDPYPPEDWRLSLPGAIDVFLPGKARWDVLKQQVIEAKLEKLGVERGSGASSAAPHIFAPHARAASISSPADPALLLYKLNKLHQTQSSQTPSPSITSLVPSTLQPGGLPPPPNRLSPSNIGSNTFQNRHGHSMSLSQPPTFVPSAISPNFNPFGVALGATPTGEQERPLSAVSDSGLLTAQQSSFLSLSNTSRSSSRPDFVRGFGLEIPEEAEEEAELDEQEKKENELRWKRYQETDHSDEEQSEIDRDDAGVVGDTEDDLVTDAGDDMDLDDEGTTVAEGGLHSRHASRLSVTLSLRSVGGNRTAAVGAKKEDEEGDFDPDRSLVGRESTPPPIRRPTGHSVFGHVVRASMSANREDLEDAVAIQEWTGSEEEDLADDLSDFDDDQSLGEFSNPSDEERARQERKERRKQMRVDKDEAKRRRQQAKQRSSLGRDGDVKSTLADAETVVDQPRRIPEFPRPPEDLVFVPTQREHYHHQSQGYLSSYQDRDDIISNPSEENMVMGPHEYRYPSTYLPPHTQNPYQQPAFLGIAPSASQTDFYNGVPRSPGGTRLTHSLPPLGVPLARGPSEPYTSHGTHGSYGHTDPSAAYTHPHNGSFGQRASSSFGPSTSLGVVSPTALQHQSHSSQTSAPGNSSGRRDSLNPFAKPFVFGKPLDPTAEPWKPSSAAVPIVSPTTSLTVPVPKPAKSSATSTESDHTRLVSLAKSLNVAAPEFKPRTTALLPVDAPFTFSVPSETSAFPVSDDDVPLAALVAKGEEARESPFKKQGREKRPRLGSSHWTDEQGDKAAEFVEPEIEAGAVKESHSPTAGNDSMASFRFPPGPVRKSHSDQPQQASAGGVEVQESTSRSLDNVKRDECDSGSDMDEVSSDEMVKENLRQRPAVRSPTPEGKDTQDTEASPRKTVEDIPAEDDEEYVQELIIPPSLPMTNLSATFPTSATTKAFPGPVTLSPIPGSAGGKRRAPIPLDFKHSTGNTVPAAKFKALVQNVIQQNKDRENAAKEANGGLSADRINYRSRMSSRENFDTQHTREPSMDDLNVTKISGTGLTGAKSTSNINGNANRSIQIPNFSGTVAYRGRNATDPIPNLARSDDEEEEDVFGGRSMSKGQRATLSHMRRRSSLPDALRDPSSSSSEKENDSDAENQFEDSSMNVIPSHTIHVSASGRRVLRSLLSRNPSPEPESDRMQRMRRSETRSRSRPRGLGSQFELHALEDALARVLDERLAELKEEWGVKGASSNGNAATGLSSASEAMLSEVVSLFRAQLQDSAAKSLEDTTMDARNDMDMFMIREMLQDGQREVVSVVKTVVEEHLHQAMMERSRGSDEAMHELKQAVETAASKTIGAVVETISDFKADQGNSPASEEDREALLDDIVTTLTPMLQGLRPEAIDYEFLTTQLAQAVKPHISQLIDLAADKRETAKLIVDALIPTLVNTLVPTLVPTLTPSLISSLAPALMDALSKTLQAESEASRLGVVKEVKKAVEGVDAIEIRDAVADLVVERLDARLGARDRTFMGSIKTSVNEVIEAVSSRMEVRSGERKEGASSALSEKDLKGLETRIVDGVKSSVAGVNRVPGLLEESFNHVTSQQRAVAQAIGGVEKGVADGTTKVLGRIDNAVAVLASRSDIDRLAERIIGTTREAASATSANTSEVKALLETLLAENRALAEKNVELVATQQSMAAKLASMPETLSAAIVNLQNGMAELIVSRDVPKRDLEELKKLNSEYQVQLTKARAAHGQARVEKDMLSEKLTSVESEREKLRAKVAELEKRKEEETGAVHARKNELEEALANALGRLQSSDVATQMQQERIAELERVAKESAAEKEALKAQLDALEVRATVAEKEKEAATAARQADEQRHWETVGQISEKVDMLTKLLGEVESDEIKHLRQYQDRTKNMEAEHTQLQKRVKELEVKLANSEKVAATTKSGLLQAQQRAGDWERTAKEYEGELEMVKTKLEQAEQTHDQLETDYSMLKMQFEEKEADDRFIRDRESRQREQINALEAKVVRLQEALAKSRTGSAANGTTTHPPPRPDSRASVSTVNGRPDRRLSSYSPAATPGSSASIHSSVYTSTSPSINGSKYAGHGSGVSSSIHAPKSRYPGIGPTSAPKYPLHVKKSAYPSYARANAASPAPSAVSAVPTQGDDGWWE